LEHAMRQHIGNPFPVLLVGFASWYLLDALPVDQQPMELVSCFQKVPYRFPINPTCFHRNPLNSQPLQPRSQLFEISPVIVPNRHLSVRNSPSSARSNAQAVTLSWCTSQPQPPS